MLYSRRQKPKSLKRVGVIKIESRKEFE